MQDVLLKLVPYLPKFDNSKALSVWLYKTARNRCLMNRRGHKNQASRHVSLDELMPTEQELGELLESREPSPETQVLRSESERHLREAVQNVPPQYRLVLVLHDMEGLTTAEVARIADLREGTVRVRLHRARLLLRRHLARMSRSHGVVASIPTTAEKPRKQSRRCRQMFAALSEYMDGLVDDLSCEQMEKHLNECKPCVAFLDSLKSAVEQCRSFQPECDPERAAQLRGELLEKYRQAATALSQNDRSQGLHDVV